jgi:hypothetical protein
VDLMPSCQPDIYKTIATRRQVLVLMVDKKICPTRVLVFVQSSGRRLFLLAETADDMEGPSMGRHKSIAVKLI